MDFQGRKCKDYFWDFTDFYYMIAPIAFLDYTDYCFGFHRLVIDFTDYFQRVSRISADLTTSVI